MIIDYDHNPAISTDQKVQSLKESVQMALNENDAEHRGFRALFDKVNATIDSIKESLTKVLTWMKSPEIHNSVANTNTFYLAKRDDTDVGVNFGVGSGGTNHGVWSNKLNKWLIYGDSTNVYVDNKIMPTFRTVVPTTAYKGTKSNDWEYVGASFTVPSGHYYLVVAIQGYASGRPIGIGLGTETNQNPPIYIATSSSTNETLYRGTFLLTGNSTYYLFTKRATVPAQTNNYNVYAIDLDV